MSKARGSKGEQLACDYLQQQGLSLLSKNYNCRLGEIDLVMQEGEYLVFIEVRLRSSQDFGGGLASITPHKQKKLKRACTHYLVSHGKYDKIPCRIDVIALDERGHIDWIKNAL